MIIGRKDRQRVERMKKTIAAQNKELEQKGEILAYKSQLVWECEEEIERWKEKDRKLRERLRELEGEAEKKTEGGSNDRTNAVGRIEYLFGDGTVGESLEFYDTDELIAEATECNYCGEPINVVVYTDENGPRIPAKRFDFVDCSSFHLAHEDAM